MEPEKKPENRWLTRLLYLAVIAMIVLAVVLGVSAAQQSGECTKVVSITTGTTVFISTNGTNSVLYNGYNITTTYEQTPLTTGPLAGTGIRGC